MNDDTGNPKPQDSTDDQDRAPAEERDQPENSITVLAWSPDGALLAIGGADGARVVDVDSGEERHRLQHDGAVSALAWSPDGALLAIAGGDGGASIFEAGSGDVRHRLQFSAGAGEAGSGTGIEHGESRLEKLQEDIDRVRSQTGEQRPHEAEDEGGEAAGKADDGEGEAGNAEDKAAEAVGEAGPVSESAASPPG